MAAREQSLHPLREQLTRSGIVVPNVPLVAWSKYGEFYPKLVECMRGQGWDVSLIGTRGMRYPNVGASQQAPMFLAEYECRSKYSEDPRYRQPLSAQQIGLMYDYAVGVTVPCLRREGYSPTQPPSRAVYIAGFGQDASWDPYESVFGTGVVQEGSSQGQILEKKCPRQPPTSLLWAN